MNIIKEQIQKVHRWWEKRRYTAARENADYLNELSGKKHIVIKLSGNYTIINRRNFLKLKNSKKYKMYKHLDWGKLQEHAMYIANKRGSAYS